MKIGDPFDYRCSCEYETKTHVCICMKKRHWNDSKSCVHCIDGNHKLIRKDILEEKK